METAEVAANDYLTSAVLTAAAHVADARPATSTARAARPSRASRSSPAPDAGIAAMAGARLAVTRRELGDPAAADRR